MESIFKPAFVLMSGRAVGFVAVFIIPVLLARLFDLDEFGTYKQLFLIYATLYCVGQLGMSESLFYFLPASPRSGGRYALNAMLVVGLAGGLCLGALWAGQTIIAAWFNNPALTEYLPLLGLFLVLMLMSSAMEIVMTARKRHTQASIAYAASDLLRCGLLILPVLWFGGMEWLLYGVIVFATLRLGATLYYLYREYDGDLVLDAGLARAQFAYAAPFSIYVLIEVLQTNLHLYVVSFRFDAAMFAIYAVGCLSIPLVEYLTSSACNVMMVRAREHLLNGSNDKILMIWRDITRKLMLLFAPMAACLLVVAHELIVGLYTDSYERSVPVFMVWVLSLLFMALLTDGMLRVYAQMRFLTVLGLIKLALLGLTIQWFLTEFGLAGGVMAVLLAAAVTKALALQRIRFVMRCSLAEFMPWRDLLAILLIAAAAAFPAWLVRSMLTAPPLLLLLYAGMVYAAAYAGLLWCYGPLSAREKSVLIEWACRPVIGLFGEHRA
jgi:O-antigen/teichoic acid export membrane protein